jgi:hypothetical protein
VTFLDELKSVIEYLGIPVETGVFSETPPDSYVVITPISDVFGVFADNLPRYESQQARLSLFKKGNYITIKNQLTTALLTADFTITDRIYVGHEDDTGYYHYAIDVLKVYDVSEINTNMEV